MAALAPVSSAPAGGAGLSAAEAARLLASRGSVRRQATSRSYSSIVCANVFTVFNAILAAAGALTLFYGNPQDALFLGVLVANTAIGVTQEVRAKRALDRLSALVTPHATAVRDGKPASSTGAAAAGNAAVIAARVALRAAAEAAYVASCGSLPRVSAASSRPYATPAATSPWSATASTTCPP